MIASQLEVNQILNQWRVWCVKVIGVVGIGDSRHVDILECPLEKYNYRQMYKLSVSVAQTYYGGEGQWLVHNAKPCEVELQGMAVAANDVLGNDFHINLNDGELGLRPTLVVRRDNQGNIIEEFIDIRVESALLVLNLRVILMLVKLLANTGPNLEKYLADNSRKVAHQAGGIVSLYAHDRTYTQPVAEGRLLQQGFSGALPYRLRR